MKTQTKNKTMPSRLPLLRRGLGRGLLLLIITLTSCKKENKMIPKLEQIQKFEWLAQTSADSLCPVEVYHGSFTDSSGATQWIPAGEYLNDRWGFSSGIMAVGDDNRKIPESMQITWFSYAEDKFFQGSFSLPQKKIYDIFKKDYGKYKLPSGQEEKEDFSNLLVSMAPEGLVTLWATGHMGQVEIGTFEAKEILIDWKDFYGSQGTVTRYEEVRDNRKDMLPFIQEDIAKGNINNKYIKGRLARYNYTIATNKPEEYTIYNYGVAFLNHEDISLKYAGLPFLTDLEDPKGIATNGNVYVKDKFGSKFEVRFDANLLEGQGLYKVSEPRQNRAKDIDYMQLWTAFFEKNKDVQFLIKFNDKVEKSDIHKPLICGKIVLKSLTTELEFPNSRVEFFDSEEW